MAFTIRLDWLYYKLINNVSGNWYLYCLFALLNNAKTLQSCPTLCDPMDHCLWGSSVHGILQAKILEWVAMPSSRGSSDPRTESVSLMLPALAEGFFTTSITWETLNSTIINILKCISVFLEDFFLEVTLLAQAFKTVGNA